MKTSELKRILKEDCVEAFDEIEVTIWGEHWAVCKTEHTLVVHGVVPLGVLKVLVEYTNTPLNEREDEKKYRIINDNTLFKDGEYLTLILNENTYYFSIFNANSEEYQRIFTQSEIDNFPAEIKGAIECGFLRKVEVE